MNWRARSDVEKMKAILDGHYEPDRSSSLLISQQGMGSSSPEDEMYGYMTLRVSPNSPSEILEASDLGKAFANALREAISEMSLPGYVHFEEIDDNPKRIGRLHGMRLVRYEKSVSERCMESIQKIVYQIVLAGIPVYINLHLLVAAIFLVIAASLPNHVVTAAIITVVIPPVIKENMNWRSFQRQKLARLAYRKEAWHESEAEYRKYLRDKCYDPHKWELTRIHVCSWISRLLIGKLLDRHKEWNASHRPSIRLAMMSVENGSL